MDQAEGSPDAEVTREIKKAAERASDLTRQLLAFSRYDKHRHGSVDLNPSIRSLQSFLRRLIREDVSLNYELRPGIGFVRLDKIQIEQVLMNLANNAAQAMPNGGELTIATDLVEWSEEEGKIRDLAGGQYTWIRVEDNGSGMSPDVAQKIFDPFYTTKEIGEGAGLGLSTVHGIICGTGGSIFVDSEPGRGSRFDIYLPHVDSGDEPETAGAVAIEKDKDLTGTESILLVEVESQIRDLAAKILTREGYRVHPFSNAEDALSKFKEQTDAFQVILTDVVLPGLRGPKLVELALEVRPDIAVVFMSGYSDPGLLHSVIDSGRPLVQKPFKPAELLRAIRQQLDAVSAKERSSGEGPDPV